MAERQKRNNTKFYKKLMFWKRGSSERYTKRSSSKAGGKRSIGVPSFPAPQPPSAEYNEMKCKLTYSNDDFAASGYYDTIPADLRSKTNLESTYVYPKGVRRVEKSHGGDRDIDPPWEQSDEHGYLVLVTGNEAASPGMDDGLLNEPERLKEVERVSRILEKQKVSDKTLFVNVEPAPALPPKSPKLKRASSIQTQKEEEREKALNNPERILAVLQNQKVTQHTLFVNFESEPPPDVPSRDSDVLSSRTPSLEQQESVDMALGDYITYDPKEGEICLLQDTEEKSQFSSLVDGRTDNINDLPSEMFPNVIVCITGVPEMITEANMSDFLKDTISVPESLSNVTFGDIGLVVVEFYRKIDLRALLDALQNTGPVGDSKLDFCQVFIPKSIILSSKEKIPLDKDLQSYFEKFGSSMTSCSAIDYGMKAISFDNSEVVYKICAESSHVIKKKHLNVSPLYKCKFGEIWDRELHERVRLPDDIHLDNIDPLLAKFIHSSPQAVGRFDRALLHYFAKLTLGEANNDISIKCLLTQSTPDVNVYANEWKSKVMEMWEKSIQELTCREEIHVPGKLAEIIRQKKTLFEQNNVEGIFFACHDDPVEVWLEMVGFKNTVKKVVFDLYRCAERVKHSVEYVKLPSAQVNILEKDDLFEGLKTDYDVGIDTNLEEGEILIRGIQTDVEIAKEKILEVSSRLPSWTLQNCSTEHIRLLQNQQTLEYVRKSINDKNLVVDVDVSDDMMVRVFAADDQHETDAKQVEKIIDECIIRETISLSDTSIILKQEWINFVKEITDKQYQGTVTITFDAKGQIILTCLRKVQQEVLTKIHDCIDRLSRAPDRDTEMYQDIRAEFDDGTTYEELRFRDEETYQNIQTVKDENQSSKSMTCRNGTTINVISGELEKQKADVLVCSTNSDLKLKIARVGRNLIKHGGENLQEECNRNYPNGIQYGDVAKIRGGKLKCKYVYLGMLRQWTIEDEGQYAKTTLYTFVKDCLKKASKKGLKSLALPAMGSGVLEYPHKAVAETMFKSVMDYDAESSKYLNVTFVIYHKDAETLKAFEGQIKSLKYRKSYITPKRNITILIEEIPLALKKVDIMVCNASRRLDFTEGRLLMSVREGGGTEMEQDCRTRYPTGIVPGEIAVVKPGSLPCTRIYFGHLPRYKDDPSNAERAFNKLIYDSLDMASKHGKSTIAFPPMGTGLLGYPHNVIARLMYNAIKDFDKRTELSVLKEVYITVLSNDKASLNAFYAEEELH